MTDMSRENHCSPNQPAKPLLIILSGPSGAGKDALINRLRVDGCRIECITTLTTRPRRPKEKENVDYHFISAEQFRNMVDNNELLEWAEVYGNWYGIPRQPIKDSLERGHDTIVKVDTQGAATLKEIVPESLFVFLTVPSHEELSLRLSQRRTETPFDLALRIKTAEEEIQQISMFDYVIVSNRDKIDLAANELQAIITAEKCRVNPRQITL